MDLHALRYLPNGGIELSSPQICATVYPRYGGKIASLRSEEGRKEWLWTDSRMNLQEVKMGAPYDDNFYGGIDELFPSDFPTCVEGVQLPDHGELWSSSWDYETFNKSGVEGIQMKTSLKTVPVDAERQVWVNDSTLVIENTLVNKSDRYIPYLWVIHPAFMISPSHRLHLPSGEIIVEDEIQGRVKKGTTGLKWPGEANGLDLSKVPVKQEALECYYIINLPEGKFCVEDLTRKQGIEATFSIQQFPHLWLFLPLGGWRGHYLAVIEPSSGYPTDLANAIKKGTHKTLKPHERISSTIEFSLVETNMK